MLAFSNADWWCEWKTVIRRLSSDETSENNFSRKLVMRGSRLTPDTTCIYAPQRLLLTQAVRSGEMVGRNFGARGSHSRHTAQRDTASHSWMSSVFSLMSFSALAVIVWNRLGELRRHWWFKNATAGRYVLFVCNWNISYLWMCISYPFLPIILNFDLNNLILLKYAREAEHK